MISKSAINECVEVIHDWMQKRGIAADEVNDLLENLQFVKANRSFALSITAMRQSYSKYLFEKLEQS